MKPAFSPPRGDSAGATGAPVLPAIDYDAYRARAARLRAEAYRQVALALRDAMVNAVRIPIRVVSRFTDARRGPCDTPVPSQSGICLSRNPLTLHMPQLLRANDNGAVSRKSESS